jgi:thioredoxin-like negative regulator of GroEL
MIESATQPAAERTEREIERLRREARSHSGGAELQLHLALLLLADGRAEEAVGEFRTLLTMHLPAHTARSERETFRPRPKIRLSA